MVLLHCQKGDNKMKTLIIINCVIACINLILALEIVSETVAQVKKIILMLNLWKKLQ